MLPPKNRLTKKEDFENVYRYGRSYSGKDIRLKVKQNSKAETRVGIVVSTKVSKLAARRNLIKRRLREILLKELSNFKGGRDIVVIALAKKDLSYSFLELEKEIRSIIQKANLIK